MARRLEPWEVLNLWAEMRGPEQDRVVGFANALANHYQGGRRQEQRTPLKWLGLPTMQFNALRRAGYLYVEDVEGLDVQRLSHVHKVGPKGVRLILAAVDRFHALQEDAA
jgi:hypothetical protein